MSDDDRDPHDAKALRAMRWLALLCVVLVTHGSLYPWQFAWPQSLSAAWDHMMHQRSWWTGLGDVVGNVVLFIPVGVLGWALLRRSPMAVLLRLTWVIGVGVAFAFALQVVQIFVPARDAVWSDVVWNTLGLLLGLLLAVPASRLPMGRLSAQPLRLPLTFVALWLLLQWWPLVPRLDWQQIKDALKPLLLHPQWKTTTRARCRAELGAAGHAVAAAAPPGRCGWPALPLAAACGALIVEGQALSVSRSAGWLFGLLLAWVSWRMPARATAMLGALIAFLWFTFDELRPFEFGESLGEFHWMPFAAQLQGSLSANTLALTWQLFWLGVVMVLVARHRCARQRVGPRIGPVDADARVVANAVAKPRGRHHAGAAAMAVVRGAAAITGVISGAGDKKCAAGSNQPPETRPLT